MKLTISRRSKPNVVRAVLMGNELEKPTVIPNRIHFNHPSPDSTILCDEACIVYLDSSKAQHIRFLGSKKMADCIGIYMTNGTEYAFVHVSVFMQQLDLRPLLNKFKNKNNINVVLVGGMKDYERSKINLTGIIDALIQAAESFDIIFEISSHKIMHRNVFNEQCKEAIVYDRIIEGVQYLSQHYFKKPFDKNIIKDFTLADFKKPYIGTALEPNYITIFGFIVANAKYLLFPELPKGLVAADEIFNLCQEPEFILFVKALFSKEGYANTMRHLDFNVLSNNGPELYNFVIDITNGHILETSEFIDTPDEVSRNAQFVDPQQSHEYRFCYDTDHYVPILFHKDFIKACLQASKNIDASIINKKNIYDFYNALFPAYPIDDTTDIKKIIKIHALLCYFQSMCETLLLLNNITQAHSSCLPLSIFYAPANIELQDFNQALAEKATFKPAFSAYTQRGSKDKQIHALMPCKNWTMANKMAHELIDLKKPADVLVTKDACFVHLIKHS